MMHGPLNIKSAGRPRGRRTTPQMGLELVCKGVGWINAAQDKDQLWTVVNTTMISPGP
jgi:hypothetical protein